MNETRSLMADLQSHGCSQVIAARLCSLKWDLANITAEACRTLIWMQRLADELVLNCTDSTTVAELAAPMRALVQKLESLDAEQQNKSREIVATISVASDLCKVSRQTLREIIGS